jgi:hypothetical protein
MLIVIALEYFKIYNISSYLLHTIKNNVEVVRLAYSVSNVIKTNYFIDFVTLVDLKKVNLRTTNKIMVAVYLLKFKKIKDIYILNFLNNYENGRKFLNKFFK